MIKTYLVEENLSLALECVEESARIIKWVDPERIQELALAGLKTAADEYHLKHGCFKDFAARKMFNTIFDARDVKHGLPKNRLNLAKVVGRARKELFFSEGHEPSREQIAEFLDLSVAHISLLDEGVP